MIYVIALDVWKNMVDPKGALGWKPMEERDRIKKELEQSFPLRKDEQVISCLDWGRFFVRLNSATVSAKQRKWVEEHHADFDGPASSDPVYRVSPFCYEKLKYGFPSPMCGERYCTICH